MAGHQLTDLTGIDREDAFANAEHIPGSKVFPGKSQAVAGPWQVPLFADPGRHHFNVIDGFVDPVQSLMRCLAED